MNFNMPWQQAAPFVPGSGQQKHVEYLTPHPRPEEERTRVVHLLVDNRDRDTGFDARRGASAPFNFVVRFDPINDAISAEIKTLFCPRPAGEPYVILDIPEFGSLLDSTDQDSHQKSAVAFFDQPVGSTDIKPIKADMISSKVVTFEGGKNLSRLDVCLRQHGGAPITVPAGSSTTVTILIDVVCRQLPGLYGV